MDGRPSRFLSYICELNEDDTLTILYPDKSETCYFIPPRLGGYPVTRIGQGAFRSIDILEKVCIPDSVTHIDAYAFAACPNLTDIRIPASVTHIGIYAFDSYGNKTKTVRVDPGSYAERYFSGKRKQFEVVLADPRNPKRQIRKSTWLAAQLLKKIHTSNMLAKLQIQHKRKAP